MYGYGYQNSGILKSGGAAVGPVNSVAPVISGTAERGETLSSTTGTWSGVGTITYSRQWKRDGLDIFGATSTTYVLVEADDNAFITCTVTATDDEGSNSRSSNTLGPVLGLPLNLTAPVLSGTETIGEILSTTNGTWQGKATITFAYQWRRDLANIGGATSNSYELVDADYQTTIDCVVTATNTFGSAAQDSNDSALIAGIAPSISGVPTFSGTESVGQTLTATAASTSGRPVPTRTWKWQRSDNGTSGWVDISGATSITYLLDAADENKYVRVVQIETNGVGSDSANSAASGQITSVPAFDADYQSVLDYGTAQGYTLPSGGQQTLQNDLVVALKAAGVWSKLDTFSVWATDGDSDFALIDWKRVTDYTAINSPTFTANVGFQGDGVSSYVDSNYNASTSGVNYVNNNYSFGWYMDTFDTAASGGENAFGAAITGNANWVRYTVKRFYYNGVSFQAYTGLTIASNQMVSANASASNLKLFANGSLTDTLTLSVSPSPANTNFLSFYQTFATGYSNSILSMVYAGGNLEAEAAAFYTAWNTYLTSI